MPTSDESIQVNEAIGFNVSPTGTLYGHVVAVDLVQGSGGELGIAMRVHGAHDAEPDAQLVLDVLIPHTSAVVNALLQALDDVQLVSRARATKMGRVS